jgi:hypothetical protein
MIVDDTVISEYQVDYTHSKKNENYINGDSDSIQRSMEQTSIDDPFTGNTRINN